MDRAMGWWLTAESCSSLDPPVSISCLVPTHKTTVCIHPTPQTERKESTYHVELCLFFHRVSSDRSGGVLVNHLETLLVKELESAQDLADVLLGCRETRLDGLEGGQREQGNVHRRRSSRAEDGDGGDDAEGSLRSNEKLLQIETYIEAR